MSENWKIIEKITNRRRFIVVQRCFRFNLYLLPYMYSHLSLYILNIPPFQQPSNPSTTMSFSPLTPTPQLPNLHLLTSMQVLSDQRSPSRHLTSAVTFPDPRTIYIGFKLSDQKICFLVFVEKCLVNLVSFVIQSEPNREVTVLEMAVMDGRMFVYLGFGTGSVSVYEHDGKLRRVKEIKGEVGKKGQVISPPVTQICVDKSGIALVRNNCVDIFSPLPQCLKLHTLTLQHSILSCLLTPSNLYVSTYSTFTIYSTSSNFTATHISADTSFYSIYQTKDMLVYLGGTDDKLHVVDFKEMKQIRFAGWKSFIMGVQERNGRVWVAGRDGRVGCFEGRELGKRKWDNKGQQTNADDLKLEDVDDGNWKHKVSDNGILTFRIEQDLVVILDTIGCVNVYEIVQPQLTTDRSKTSRR